MTSKFLQPFRHTSEMNILQIGTHYMSMIIWTLLALLFIQFIAFGIIKFILNIYQHYIQFGSFGIIWKS